MTVRGGATKSWWWLACLLAGCVQHREQQPGGTFGHSRSDLFSDPVAAAEADPVAEVDPAAEVDPVVEVDPAAKAPASEAAAPELPGAPDDAPELASTTPAPRIARPTPSTPAHGELATSNRPAAAAIDATATRTEQPPSSATAVASARSERQLRNAFANADQEHAGQAALELAGYLVIRERHFEALFVVDTAIKRHRTVPLRLARAGLLRDLARCDDAAAELQGVVREIGAKNVSPATLFDLVQAEWVAGQGAAAAATLRSIQQMHAGDAWLRDHATEMADWDQRIREVTPGRDPLANGELRDLFALLRAAPEAAGRLKMLDTLAVPPKPRPGPNAASDQAAIDARRPLRMRAIAIACADESTAVRARAVHLAAVNRLSDEAFWEVALTDPAPLVRRFAASGAAQQHGRKAVTKLFAAISHERDPAAFASLHAALAAALEVIAPTCEADTEFGRHQAVAHWRSQCQQ